MKIRSWDKDVDDESELWVCPSCDAHLHVDCVGDVCPACGEEVGDEEQGD